MTDLPGSTPVPALLSPAGDSLLKHSMLQQAPATAIMSNQHEVRNNDFSLLAVIHPALLTALA